MMIQCECCGERTETKQNEYGVTLCETCSELDRIAEDISIIDDLYRLECEREHYREEGW